MDVLRALVDEVPRAAEFARLSSRLLVAVAVGGLLGYERQRSHKSAGLRTLMLVSLGSATFVLAPIAAGGDLSAVAHVVQGVAAGIGFIGAGVILKATEE